MPQRVKRSFQTRRNAPKEIRPLGELWFQPLDTLLERQACSHGTYGDKLKARFWGSATVTELPMTLGLATAVVDVDIKEENKENIVKVEAEDDM